ncbi:LPS assembly lipoprotein LptE [Gymnodinialimonas sp. 2305UL16-5]|uniref:LPS assembly lipoprotein LptE n=1 Tax=Gymnodinialimonas mytili TaxID=3126503 RepID=UPI0030974AF6
MLLSSRRLTLFLLLAPLAACNFQPVYGPGGSGEAVRNQITVAEPNTREEFELVARLEDRLGVGSRYALDYQFGIGEASIAVDGADNINRVNVNGTVSYTLRDALSGAVIHSGSVRTFTSFATTSSPVATSAARRDARDRLAVALADQLVTDLILTAPRWSSPGNEA